MPSLAPGLLLHNRYRIVGVAATSRWGQTYLARDQKRSEALCVLKEFTLPSLEPQQLKLLQQRFQVAANVLYKLNHAQLPRYQVLIFEDDRGYWVREYIEGKDYKTLLAERGQAFSEAEVLHLLETVRPVLEYLHQQGVIHRDVSLENLILRDRDQLPVLINYGLVQELIAQLQAATRKFRPTPATPETDWSALAEVAIALLSSSAAGDDRSLKARLLADPGLQQLYSRSKPGPPTSTRRSQRPAAKNQDRPSDRNPSARKTFPRTALAAEPLASAALVVSLLVLVSVVSLRVLSGSTPLKPPPANDPVPAPSTAQPNPEALPVPTPPPPPTGGDDEPTRLEAFHTALPEALRDRRLQLGVDLAFFVKLVDDSFYSKFPELKGRRLGKEALEKYRPEWNTIAASLLDKLQTLTPETRGKLGTYQRSNYEQWMKTIGEPRNQKLDDVTDRRFYDLLPDQKGKPQNPRTFGQIWYAIAQEQSQRKDW